MVRPPESSITEETSSVSESDSEALSETEAGGGGFPQEKGRLSPAGLSGQPAAAAWFAAYPAQSPLGARL